MANPRTTSEFWDGSEEEFQHELHYPNATPRRALFAHVLGVVGVLGTVALAAFAFAPRMGQLGTLFLKDEPAQYPPKPVDQLPAAQAPATPVTNSEPTPNVAQAQPPGANAVAAVAPPDVTVTEPKAVAAAPAPANTALAPVEGATTPPEGAAMQPPAVAAPSAVTTPAPVLAAPAAPSGTSDQTPPAAATNGSGASSKSAAPARAPAAARRAPREEPTLTAREIQRRKDRYEAWLKDQGLEPVH